MSFCVEKWDFQKYWDRWRQYPGVSRGIIEPCAYDFVKTLQRFLHFQITRLNEDFEQIKTGICEGDHVRLKINCCCYLDSLVGARNLTTHIFHGDVVEIYSSEEVVTKIQVLFVSLLNDFVKAVIGGLLIDNALGSVAFFDTYWIRCNADLNSIPY